MSVLFYLPKAVRIQGDGRPYANAQAFFYETGTLNDKDVFTNASLTVAFSQPVQADSEGQFPPIYLDETQTYKLILKTASGLQIDNIDPCFVGLQFTQAELGALLYPRTSAEIAASITPTNNTYPERNLLRYSGVIADGVTDCTTAVLAVCNAMGGTFTLPYNVLIDIATLLATLDSDVVILDYSQINNYTSAGETTKSVGVIASDEAVSDSDWRIVSGHNTGLTMLNLGTAGSSSAAARVVTAAWGTGIHANQGLDKRGTRYGGYWHFSKETSTTWRFRIGMLAPWEAIEGAWEFYTIGETVAAGDYRSKNNKHYKASAISTGICDATGPSHTTGSAVSGGVTWDFIDYFDTNCVSFNQFGQQLLGPVGSYVTTLNVFAGAAGILAQSDGVSKVATFNLVPTDSGGVASVTMPTLVAQDSLGWRIFNHGSTRELIRFTDTDTRFPDTQVSFAISATAPDVADNGTIATANVTVARVQPAGSRTGVILEAGTVAGQKLVVENNSANTITFATAATSNVADGATSPIPALCCRTFYWSAAATRWFRAA